MHRTGTAPVLRNDGRTRVMLAARIPNGIRPSPPDQACAALFIVGRCLEAPLAQSLATNNPCSKRSAKFEPNLDTISSGRL